MGGEVRQYRVAPHPAALRALGVDLRAGREGAGAVRRQHRRRLHRPVFPRIPHPQHRPHHQPRRSAQHRRGDASTTARSICGRSRRSNSPPRSSAATPATWASRRSSSRSRSSRTSIPSGSPARSSRRSQDLTATLPQGIKADQILFRQANFIEASIRNVQRVLLEAALVVAVVLFAFLLNWRTTAISLTAIPVSILDHRGDFPFRRPVDQHDDAGRPRHRDWRAGRRRGRGRREHLPPAAREPRARQSAPGLRRRGVGVAGGPLRHRLCDDDHRPGVRAAVRAVGHRGPAVRAARARLHHLDPREPRGVDHADAGDGLLHAARPQAARASATAPLVRVLKRGNRAAARAGLPARRLVIAADRSLAVAIAGRWPHFCFRARSCRPSTRARSPSTCCSIPASRWPNPTASG